MIVYPSPVQDELFIEFGQVSGIGRIDMYDARGAAVFGSELDGPEIMVDVSDLNEGIYTIRATMDDDVYVTRVTVQR
jgi:hypothetical protein